MAKRNPKVTPKRKAVLTAFQVRLDSDVVSFLDHWAADQHMSRNSLIRSMLRQGMLTAKALESRAAQPLFAELEKNVAELLDRAMQERESSRRIVGAPVNPRGRK